MISVSIGLLLGLIIGFALTYILLSKTAVKRFEYIEAQAKAKAKVIESESRILLEEAKVAIKKEELRFEKKINQKMSDIEKLENDINRQKNDLNNFEDKLNKFSQYLKNKEKKLEELEVEKQTAIDKNLQILSNPASLTQSEAKAYILQEVEKRLKNDIAAIVRKYEKIAKEEAEKRANYILAQATTRYAGEFAGERLINIVTLPTDEHKGRIIGKDGRNIKTLEMLLGVDIIIDETPNTIIVSGFNLYRRAIATRVIDILVEDGRIHPARIEDVFKKVNQEFEQKIYEEGKNILIDLGQLPMHEELIKMLGKLRYRASYGQNALVHTLEVANLAMIMAAEMGGDEKLAQRAGLLHDIGKAYTQEFGGSHVKIGAELCKRYNENPIVINAIYAHHGYEEPNCIESAAVCTADILSASRPGARREVLESFTKRVTELENIALSKENVEYAYAINAGREIRVIVNAKKVSDNEAVMLSKDIAKDIEANVQYPAEIKVNVIRETRAVSFAK
ncbi:MAG: ribonuclease Y [Sulfurovum sp. AS07-7]|nr:MAG: ribonuclease Y [Sulfurovum sp. AS07-7]